MRYSLYSIYGMLAQSLDNICIIMIHNFALIVGTYIVNIKNFAMHYYLFKFN